MALSEETLKKRYGGLQPLARIETMIEDCVDTSIIMEEVRSYGQLRYDRGVEHGYGRAQVRPGYGDMGG